MNERLKTILFNVRSIVPGAPIGDVVEAGAVQRLRSVGYDSSKREHAFVAMPFADEFEDLFHYGISNAVRSTALLCERIDQQAFTGDILDRLKQQIRTARIVVAELSRSNPNVYLEVGYAWGCGVDTVLMLRNGEDLKFDVQGQRCLKYSSIVEAEKLLMGELEGLLER